MRSACACLRRSLEQDREIEIFNFFDELRRIAPATKQ